jgi:RNA polymerase sigma-70 factor (ECF subfamily)
MAETAVFLGLRPTLFGVAYRMLGSASEAEDVLQEAFLRWQAQDDGTVESPKAFLTSVVTRLCIDQLGSARARRETYVGQWLPEPVSTEPEPGRAAELADSLSLAFLVLLEELSPAERAAFILREVFGYSYEETASMLERNQAACRQLVSRAHRQIDGRRRRFDADRARGQELVERFLVACGGGDVDGLLSLLAPDVVVWTDGGGRARAAPRPVVGPARATRFLINVAKRLPADAVVRIAVLNGQPGIVVEEGGAATLATTFDVIDGVICGVRIVSNPDKLGAVGAPGTTSEGAVPTP